MDIRCLIKATSGALWRGRPRLRRKMKRYEKCKLDLGYENWDTVALIIIHVNYSYS